MFQPASPADGAPRGDWWTGFGDSTLDGLEAQVDTANPTLAASLAILQQARAFAAEAQAGLYPTLSIAGHSLIPTGNPIVGRHVASASRTSISTQWHRSPGPITKSISGTR